MYNDENNPVLTTLAPTTTTTETTTMTTLVTVTLVPTGNKEVFMVASRACFTIDVTPCNYSRNNRL